MTLRTACGSVVDEAAQVETVVYRGQVYAFCTPRCRALFEADPERYLPLRACPTSFEAQEPREEQDD